MRLHGTILVFLLIAPHAPPAAHAAGDELQEAIAQADRSDPGWTYEALLRKRSEVRPPDDRNGVLQVERTAKLLSESWLGKPTDPIEGLEDPAAIPRGAALADSLTKQATRQSLAAKQIAGLRAELDDLGPAVFEARRLLDYPEGQTAFAPAENPLATLLPGLESARRVGRLLELDVLRRLADGDPAGAIESTRALVNVAASIGDEPTLISQIVRWVLDNLAVESTLRILGKTVPPPRTLERLQSKLAQEAEPNGFLSAVRGERASFFDLLDKLATNRLPDSAIGNDAPEFVPGLKNLTNAFFRQGFYRHNQAVGLNLLTDLVEVAKQPAWKMPEGLDSWNEHLLAVCKGNRQNGMISLLMPVFDSALLASLRTSCRLRCAAAAVACERFRQQTGRWPQSLDELGPLYVASPLVDPYTGDPILLKATPTGLLIYGLDLDRHDDSGRLATSIKDRGGFDVGVEIFDVEHRGTDRTKAAAGIIGEGQTP
jgi:hypothetical protein